MKTKQPLVSVLMTVYNREKYIAQAIESVMASTYQNWELIIVDDQSKDRSVEIAQNYRAKDDRIYVYVNEQNLGDYPNRNRAASYAKGKYLKYLDSDDLMYPHSLTAYVTFMESYPEVAYGVISSLTTTIKPFPHVLTPHESIREHFFKHHFLDCAPTGSIIKREVFESLNGFSGKRMIGDIEFGLKIAAKYPVMILPPALVFWREHGDQEVFYGIKNNMYKTMMGEVLNVFFENIKSDILTDNEKSNILKNQNKFKLFDQIKRLLKH